jgi:hypothetical protein
VHFPLSIAPGSANRHTTHATEPPQIETAVADVSIAAVRAWLKARGLPHTAGTRRQLVERLSKLLREGKITEAELAAALASFEEASAKRVSIFTLDPVALEELRDEKAFANRLRRVGIALSGQAVPAPPRPTLPTLVYLLRRDLQIRGKWAETHTKVEVDFARRKLVYTPVVKITVLAADLDCGMVQVRCEKPERDHPHRDSSGQPDARLYAAFYLTKASEILGGALQPIDLRSALRSLVETEPRIVSIKLNDFRTAVNSRVRFASRADVRDDADWKAMHAEGGELWAYDGEHVYWLPEASGGCLERQVFTAIDARAGRLRLEADCHERELEYVVSKIREHQAKVSWPQPSA